MVRNELIAAVKVRMDETTPDDSVIVVANTLIDQLLDEQIYPFLEFIPPHLLDCKFDPAVSKTTYADGHGEILLPEDFLKLVRLRMSEWDKAVTLTCNEGSAVAQMQSHTYTRGGTKRPVVVSGNNATGKKVLRYYSIASVHTVAEFVYIPKMQLEELDNRFLDPLAWYIASVAFQVLENMEASKMALSKVVDFIKQHI